MATIFVSFLATGYVDADDHSASTKEHIDKGVRYGNAGAIEKAIDEFEAILEYDPDNTDAFNNLGVAYFRLGKFEKSLHYHTKAVETSSDNPRVHFNRGLLLGKYMGRHADAIQDYSAAIRLDPDFGRAYLNRAFAYDAVGDSANAVNDYYKVVEFDPDSRRLLIDQIVHSLVELGRYDQAAQEAKAAHEMGVAIDQHDMEKLQRDVPPISEPPRNEEADQ